MENYKELKKVLELAYERCSSGKGEERHGDPKPFEQQDMITEQKIFGIGPVLAQIRKKAKEAYRLPDEEASLELLDIIVYAAGGYIYLERKRIEERS